MWQLETATNILPIDSPRSKVPGGNTRKNCFFFARGLSATGFSLLYRRRISRISNQNYQVIKIPMKSISLSDDGQQPTNTEIYANKTSVTTKDNQKQLHSSSHLIFPLLLWRKTHFPKQISPSFIFSGNAVLKFKSFISILEPGSFS